MKHSSDHGEFEITACHANRAGYASVALRHKGTGATLAIQNVPFSHDYAESAGDECRRIAGAAVEIGTRALVELASLPRMVEIVEEPAPGAAPNDAAPQDGPVRSEP